MFVIVANFQKNIYQHVFVFVSRRPSRRTRLCVFVLLHKSSDCVSVNVMALTGRGRVLELVHVSFLGVFIFLSSL